MNLAKNRIAASAIGAMGVILWATETTLVTYTTAIPPLQTVAIAFFFAAAMSPGVWLVTRSHPLLAFRQPLRVWILTVGSLVGYHACIYYATQKAPPAAAALLQGTTPLMIVLGSAFLPGERLRWWHVVGAVMGLAGVISLIDPGDHASLSDGAPFYLSLIGVAAALWGLYSVLTRTLPEVPSSALGLFYAASAVVSFVAHLGLEPWVQPNTTEWLAMAALGCLPMGLAIYFWDYGLKRGDIQALGAFSYVEPFIGALLVALFTRAVLDISLLWAGLLVVCGAIVASASLWKRQRESAGDVRAPANGTRGTAILDALATVSTREDLSSVSNSILERLMEIGQDYADPRKHDVEIRQLLHALSLSISVWDECESADARQLDAA
ncbi:DMT family transporter [Rhizobium sp. P32RR-XVIII]|uniref:DMT family transporter n=1 Tax=Rhizobium sp. P32RR-XVIII TaxID=2726738 RepID=UPI00145641BE|nr:DMT family transporter [Rhizobium sp. P32RR-XVIII]NLS03928.1 DMT family transporter [Rhizobium sp. P32RR-XVIII]